MARKSAKHPPYAIARSVGALGVMAHTMLYDSPALQAVRTKARGRLRVGIVVDPSDLGEVVAFLPDGTSIRLEAVNPAYARGLTLHQHLAILREARTKVPRAEQPWVRGNVERFFSTLRYQLVGLGVGDGQEHS